MDRRDVCVNLGIFPDLLRGGSYLSLSLSFYRSWVLIDCGFSWVVGVGVGGFSVLR